jgi:hypothetical protein
MVHSAGRQHDPNDSPSVPTEPQQFRHFFPFLDLPDELQLKILRCALVSECQLEISVENPSIAFRSDLSSQLLRVSKHFQSLAQPTLYGKNVFKISAYGTLNTIKFLQAIGSDNRDLIDHLAVGVPYRHALAYRHQSPFLTKVLKHVSFLELQFNWSKVHPEKRTAQLVDYKPALKALAMILRIGRRGSCYRNLERVVTLPSPAASALLPRVKLAPGYYQLKQGVSSPNFVWPELYANLLCRRPSWTSVLNYRDLGRLAKVARWPWAECARGGIRELW